MRWRCWSISLSKSMINQSVSGEEGERDKCRSEGDIIYPCAVCQSQRGVRDGKDKESAEERAVDPED